MHKKTIALSIAGFDPSAGAGVLADVETFRHFGFFGMAAVTALTAQDSRNVFAASPASPALLEAQLKAIRDDFQVCAVKMGILPDVKLVRVVASFLEGLPEGVPVVCDPVFKSKSGFRFCSRKVIDAIATEIFPYCTVVTPNAMEAAQLSGVEAVRRENVAVVLEAISRMGSKVVILKGGHIEGPRVCDYVWSHGSISVIRSIRIRGSAVRGLGCRHSSAVAALLARGFPVEKAARLAHDFIARHVLGAACQLGKGAKYPLPR